MTRRLFFLAALQPLLACLPASPDRCSSIYAADWGETGCEAGALAALAKGSEGSYDSYALEAAEEEYCGFYDTGDGDGRVPTAKSEVEIDTCTSVYRDAYVSCFNSVQSALEE